MSTTIADRVWCMERNDVVVLMAKFNIDHDECDGGPSCQCDEDVLRSMVFSFCASIPNADLLLEIVDNFGESFELVQALMDSSSSKLTRDLVTQLAEDKSVPTVVMDASLQRGVVAPLFEELDCISTLVVCDDTTDAVDANAAGFDENVPLVTEVRLTQPSPHAPVLVRIQSLPSRLPFGVNDLSVVLQRRTKADQNSAESVLTTQSLQYTQRVLVTSPVFRFAAALDAMFDRLYWGWEGLWSDALESALFELLVAVDDDLVEMVKSWVAMLSVTGGADDMHHMLQCVTLDVQNALNSHSVQAIGRLHQTLVQFTDTKSMSMSMMRVPEVFVRATNAFIQAKMDASEPGNMKRDLEKLVFAAEEYLQELSTSVGGTSNSCTKQTLTAMIQSAKTCIDTYTAATTTNATTNTAPNTTNATSNTTTLVTLELAQLIHSLKPQGLDLITRSSITSWENTRIDTTPSVQLDFITNPFLLHQTMYRLSETLVMDAFNIGTVMGYTINESNVAQSAALISCMLEVGIAYVTSEAGKLMGLLPMERSMLILNDPANSSRAGDGSGGNNAVSTGSSGSDGVRGNNVWTDANTTPTHIPFTIPPQLRKRSKDMHRVFRNNVKSTLSLRLNSNIDLAIQKLRQHHGSDCWVGTALQSVWKCMASTTPPQLLIFELWYGEEMIAADYAHPVCNGRSVYVATRFYNRDAQYRNLVPGFMLALVVTKYLQGLGCCIWDLGTSNLCPLMRYKLDLTGAPYSRPVAQYELLRAHNSAGAVVGSASNGSVRDLMSLRAGVLIDNITTAHLLA